MILESRHKCQRGGAAVSVAKKPRSAVSSSLQVTGNVIVSEVVFPSSFPVFSFCCFSCSFLFCLSDTSNVLLDEAKEEVDAPLTRKK